MNGAKSTPTKLTWTSAALNYCWNTYAEVKSIQIHQVDRVQNISKHNSLKKQTNADIDTLTHYRSEEHTSELQ